jgi:predicted nuclease of predicted toxin-antitoxin system
MRILVDENVPVDVLTVLSGHGHLAQSINFLGWKGMQNGEILTYASNEFELLLTRDKDFDIEHLGQYARGNFGVVLLALRQQPGPAYAAEFAKLWPADASIFLGKVSSLGTQR